MAKIPKPKKRLLQMVDYIVKNSCFITVLNENIIVWKHNKNLSHKIQLNAP